MVALGVFYVSIGIGISFLSLFYLYVRKMAKAGSPFFKIGYFLYTRTPVGSVYYRREVAKASRKYNNEPHSITTATAFNDLEILPIPISQDNLSYLVTDKKCNVSVLIDPADPEPIQRVLDNKGITPSAVLTTHKHWDHSYGNAEWKKRYKNIQVYGGALDNVPGVTHGVKEGDHLQVGQLSFHVHFTPGHTVGHVVYVLDGSPFGAPPQLFSGDHLFLAAVGRMFECTPMEMLQSIDKVAALPNETLVWPGHEYAKENLEFARYIDPDNEVLKNKLDWVNDRRKGRQISSPSTIEEEKQYNPFLRTHVVAFYQSLGLDIDGESISDVQRAAAIKEIRARKDKFKYKL